MTTIALNSTLIIGSQDDDQGTTATSVEIDGTATSPVTIQGASVAEPSAEDPVFKVEDGYTLTLSHVAITGGDVSGIQNSGTLNVLYSVLMANTAGSGANGGAIDNEGSDGSATLIISDTALLDNTASGNGGAIYNGPGAMTFIANSTLSGNHATEGGAVYGYPPLMGLAAGVFLPAGVLDSDGPPVIITNSTLSGNTSSSGAALSYGPGQDRDLAVRSTILDDENECGSAIVDDGHNLLTPSESNGNSESNSCGLATGTPNLFTDPELSPAGLVYNGGPTQTIALLAGSLALGAGDCQSDAGASGYSYPQVYTDQRGIGYPRGNPCDVGAFEQQVLLATPTWTATVPVRQPVRPIPPRRLSFRRAPPPPRHRVPRP